MSQIQFPSAFEQRMRQRLDKTWQEFENAHRQPSPVSIRVNRKKVKSPLYSNNIPWTSHGYYIDERPSFTLDPLFHAGSYYVQEASSMFLEQAFLQAVDQTKTINVLDLCAAPGGKSTHLLSLMNNESLLVTNDVIRSRASILAENIQKWGYDNVAVTNNDPKDFKRMTGFFDVIVVDAPCSGEGLFRKDAAAIDQWSMDNVALCAKRQQRILSDVWPALKEGGILIYSTCTYNESENEDNLIWLANEQNVEFVPLKVDKECGIEVIEKSQLLGYRFFPHLVRGEGFFISVVRKTGDQAEVRIKNKHSFTGPSKKTMEQMPGWLLVPEEKTFILRNDQVQFFPRSKTSEIEFLSKNSHLITAGTVLASVKHEKLIPEHASALSVELNKKNFNVIDLDLAGALQFLRKDSLSVMSDKKGFAVIQYKDTPLGWVNVLENRLNNLYPSEWRIRMSDKGS